MLEEPFRPRPQCPAADGERFAVVSSESSSPTVGGGLDERRGLEVVSLGAPGAEGVRRFLADALAPVRCCPSLWISSDLRRRSIGKVDRQACRECHRSPCKAVARTSVEQPKRVTS